MRAYADRKYAALQRAYGAGNESKRRRFIRFLLFFMEWKKIISSGSALELWQGFRIGGRKNR
jgi:hypothetical protein